LQKQHFLVFAVVVALIVRIAFTREYFDRSFGWVTIQMIAAKVTKRESTRILQAAESASPDRHRAYG